MRLSRRTAVYAYYSRINNLSNAAYDIAIHSVGFHAGTDPQTFAPGTRRNF